MKMMLDPSSFQLISNWMYRNARPLDLARWRFHFESGDKEEVLSALSAYQNADGGFGHGIEPDCWNPNSWPIGAQVACKILKEIDFFDKKHPIIRGILRYLDNGANFTGKGWHRKVSTNNDFPHAVWWTNNQDYESNMKENWEYNPTAALVGFILRVADQNSDIYKKGLKIAHEAFERLVSVDSVETHELLCFCHLFEDINLMNLQDEFNIELIKSYLRKHVDNSIEKDITKWGYYVPRPSKYIRSSDSIFFHDHENLIEEDISFILKTRNVEGVWDIPWKWYQFEKEFEIAKNWWKAEFIISNMLLLKEFGKIDL
jgi:hypothetical protein